jgi:hypothetical protein
MAANVLAYCTEGKISAKSRHTARAQASARDARGCGRGLTTGLRTRDGIEPGGLDLEESLAPST